MASAQQPSKLALIAKLSEGFSKLNLSQREERLLAMGYINAKELSILKKQSSLDMKLIEHLIENAIGCYPIPVGLAMNFIIDEKPYVIPMAIEETSVIASASKTAKWIRKHGRITTQTLGKFSFGQIQIPKVTDYERLVLRIELKKQELIDVANHKVAAGFVARGGGVKDIVVRKLPRGDGYDMAVLHVLVDTCDAMGANFINQICEHLKPYVENITDEKVGMCILSNLSDTKLTRAEIVLNDIDPEEAEGIEEASLFAQIDSYRAATNNKGVMNGIDSVLIATGNDWRAVEASVHAYAAKSGKYTSITKWVREGNSLHGILEAPIMVGIVGGLTRLHPVAQICLKLLDVTSAEGLARVVAAVGLVQNLAALHALSTHGIVAGHMKLHIANMAIAAGATHEELDVLKKLLSERLKENKHITSKDVKELIQHIREQSTTK